MLLQSPVALLSAQLAFAVLQWQITASTTVASLINTASCFKNIFSPWTVNVQCPFLTYYKKKKGIENE